MKLALATHTPEVSEPPPVALLSGSFDERLQKAARMGYDGVELMSARPVELDGAEIRRRLKLLNLEACAVASGPVFMLDRLTLLAESAEARQQAGARLNDLIRFADAVGAPLVTVGSFRGRAARVGAGAAVILAEMLSIAGALAGQYGVRLAIEPLNRYEADLIQNAAEGLAFLHSVDSPSVGLLLDTFHMNIEEADPCQTALNTYRSGRLWHIHLGDSNRLAPGDGHFNFPALIGALEQAGYRDYWSAELLPRPDPDTAAARTIAYMRNCSK
jgi:sugar phosphate isomerase/epimerase